MLLALTAVVAQPCEERRLHTSSGRSWTRSLQKVLAVLLLVGVVRTAEAQLPKPTPPAPAKAESIDPLRRETPRSSVEGFVKCIARDDLATAARYLQPTPGVNLIEVVKQAEVLRSYFEGDLLLISDEPNGDVESGLPPGEERVGTIKIDGSAVDVILVQVDNPAYGKIWLVSSETVAKLPQLYTQAKGEGPTLAERLLPAALADHHLLGMSLALWIGWLLSIPVSWVIAWLLAFLFSSPKRLWNKLRNSHVKTVWETEFGLPLKCILAVFVNGVFVYELRPPLIYREYYTRLLGALLVVCLAWLVSQAADRAFDHAVNRRRTQRRGGEAILVLMQRVNRIVLAIVAFVAALAMFGIDVKTTLAGLGIGGLAIALGAQKSLENLIGGVSLLIDKAVHTGDFVEIGGRLGTVEDIGLRSLRMRTLDQTLLVVPNAALAQAQFENMKTRAKLLINQDFSLRIETPVHQLREVLNNVQRMLNEHNAVEPGSSRIRVASFAGSAFKLELWAYINTSDWVQFTVIRQEIILNIAEIIEAAGTRLAAPTQLTYLSNDAGIRAELVNSAGVA
jgi:MscS family membrane protein